MSDTVSKSAQGKRRDFRDFTTGIRTIFSTHEERSDDTRALQIIALSTAIIAMVVIAFSIHAARWLLIPIVTAFVISILLAPAVDSLRKFKLPEGARAGIVVFLSLAALLSSIYFLAKPAISFSARLPEIVSEARDKLTGVEQAVTAVQDVTEEVGKITDLEPLQDKPQEVVIAQPSVPAAIASSTRLLVVQSIFVSVLVFFLLSARSDLKKKALMAPRTLRGRLQIARTMRDIEKNVGAYMFTMLIINSFLAAATAAAMIALGTPSPLLWGALAGILNFLPYVGPITVTVLLGLTGVVNFDTGLGMAAPALAYIALNFIESNFITPAFVGVRLRLAPIAIILTISFWTWIWGPIGAVISIPMLVILKAICDRSHTLRPLGILIGELETIDRRAIRGLRIKTYAKNQSAA